MHWLSKVGRLAHFAIQRNVCHYTQQPAWGRSREFDITTRTVNRHGLTQSTSGDLEDDEDDESEDLATRRKRKGVVFPLVHV